MIFNKNINLSANEKNNMYYVNMQLSHELKIAIGHESIGKFAEKCRIVDERVLVDIFYKKLNTPPDWQLLRKIADNSDGRVTYKRLYDICGYDEKEIETDRRWASVVPQRGMVYSVDFGYFNIDSEQNGIRPAVVLSNFLNNKYADVVQIAPITKQIKKNIPVHVKLTKADGMHEDSIILVEQARVISKRRLFYNGFPNPMLKLSDEKIFELNNAIEKQFGIKNIMYDEQVAYEMIRKIKALEYNVQNKRSFDLVDILSEARNRFEEYCKSYGISGDIVRQDYDRSIFGVMRA